MNIPWQQIAPETLDNLIREFVLREGTDYGTHEVSLDTKVEQVKNKYKQVKQSLFTQNYMKQ